MYVIGKIENGDLVVNLKGYKFVVTVDNGELKAYVESEGKKFTETSNTIEQILAGTAILTNSKDTLKVKNSAVVKPRKRSRKSKVIEEV